MKESSIEKAICKYARENGWLCYKFVSPSHKGVPDRLFINQHGVTCYLEIKRPGEKPTPLQLREQRLLMDRYTPVDWVDNLYAGILFLDYRKDHKLA